MPGIRRLLTLLLATAAVSYMALLAAVFVKQRALLFPAPLDARPPSPRSTVVTLEETVLLVRAPPSPDAPVVLHFHGNAEQLADTEWMADAWARAGAGFVAVEYPGYGPARASGSPSEESITRAARTAMSYIRGTMQVADARLVVSGQSVGTGPAVLLASEGVGAKLVLVTPYTSLPDVAARAFPFLPVRLLMRDRFDNRSRAPRINVPTLVIHGTADEVIPFDLGASLAGAIPGARLVRIEGATHNDVVGRPAVWEALVAFVKGSGPR